MSWEALENDVEYQRFCKLFDRFTAETGKTPLSAWYEWEAWLEAHADILAEDDEYQG